MELRGVPGGSIGEGDGFSFGGGQFVKTAGEGIIVMSDKFRRVFRQRGRGGSQFRGEKSRKSRSVNGF